MAGSVPEEADTPWGHNCSVTRFGYFWKVSVTYSLTKLAQILGNNLHYFKNLSFYVKNWFDHIFGNFGENWATFISSVWSQWTQI